MGHCGNFSVFTVEIVTVKQSHPVEDISALILGIFHKSADKIDDTVGQSLTIILEINKSTLQTTLLCLCDKCSSRTSKQGFLKGLDYYLAKLLIRVGIFRTKTTKLMISCDNI